MYSQRGFYEKLSCDYIKQWGDFPLLLSGKGSFHYVSIYQGEKQIALIETFLNTTDYKYYHKLYVLEDYNRFADTLSFFVLYCSNYYFSKRFHMTKGSYSVKSWNFSKYNNKYDPKWRETNFPDENFFGKTSLFK